jgi:hypothetical protein
MDYPAGSAWDKKSQIFLEVNYGQLDQKGCSHHTSETSRNIRNKKQVVPHSTLGPNGAISNPKPDPLSRSDLMINLQNLRFRSSNWNSRSHPHHLPPSPWRQADPAHALPLDAFGILEKVLMRKTLQSKIKHSNTKSPIHWCCSLQSLRLYRTYYCHVSLPESIMIYSIGILYVELGQVQQFNRIHRAVKVPRFWDSYHSYPNPSPVESSNSVRLRAFEVKSRRIEPG